MCGRDRKERRKRCEVVMNTLLQNIRSKDSSHPSPFHSSALPLPPPHLSTALFPRLPSCSRVSSRCSLVSSVMNVCVVRSVRVGPTCVLNKKSPCAKLPAKLDHKRHVNDSILAPVCVMLLEAKGIDICDITVISCDMRLHHVTSHDAPMIHHVTSHGALTYDST